MEFVRHRHRCVAGFSVPGILSTAIICINYWNLSRRLHAREVCPYVHIVPKLLDTSQTSANSTSESPRSINWGLFLKLTIP